MPTSDGENKQVVVDWFRQINPKRILDIGAGEGTYRKLIKDSDIEKQGFWTAVEAWAPYVNDYKLGELYDNVIIGDACYIDYDKIDSRSFDLVIAGDVLEHMTKNEAKELIREFKNHSKNIIISVPLLHLHQDAYKGTWFEVHLDHWTFEEMQNELGALLVASVEGPTLGYFWWSMEDKK